MGEHGTREQEVDDFLRQEVLVDLYRVVKQVAAGLDRRATRSRRSRSSTASSARPRWRAATSRSSASRSGSRPATTRSSRRSSATTRRTAARRTSCTSGCARSGRPTVPWRLPPDQRPPTEEAEERDAAREAPARRGCSTAPRRASRGGCSRTCSTTTARGEARSGGSGSASSQLDDDELVERPHRDRRARAGRRAARGRGTEPRLHVRVPAAGAQDRREGASIPRREQGYRVAGRRRAAASSPCCAAKIACGRAAAARR